MRIHRLPLTGYGETQGFGALGLTVTGGVGQYPT